MTSDEPESFKKETAGARSHLIRKMIKPADWPEGTTHAQTEGTISIDASCTLQTQHTLPNLSCLTESENGTEKRLSMIFCHQSKGFGRPSPT